MTDSLDRMMTRVEVSEATGLPESTLYRAVQLGNFPAPFVLTNRRVAWRESEVREWLESRQRREVRPPTGERAPK